MFDPRYDQSEEELFAKRRRQQDLAQMPFKQSVQAEANYQNFFATHRAGQELGAIAKLLNPTGPVAQAWMESEQNRRINILADMEEKAEKDNTESVTVLSGKDLDDDRFKATRKDHEKSSITSGEFRERGIDVEVANEIENSSGFKRQALAAQYLQKETANTITYINNAFINDARWLRLGDSEVQINGYHNPTQRKIISDFLKHEYMKTKGLYVFTRDMSNKSGFTKGVATSLAKSQADHRKAFTKDTRENRINLAWELVEDGLGAEDPPSLDALISAYRGQKEDGGVYSNTEILEDVVKHVMDLSEVNQEDAEKLKNWLSTAEYSIGGGQKVKLSPNRIKKIEEKIVKEGTTQVEEDLERLELGKNIESSSFFDKIAAANGDTDKIQQAITETQTWWRSQPFGKDGTQAPWVRKYQQFQRADPKAQRNLLKDLIDSDSPIPPYMFEDVHDDNREWLQNQRKEYDLKRSVLDSDAAKRALGIVKALPVTAFQLTDAVKLNTKALEYQDFIEERFTKYLKSFAPHHLDNPQQAIDLAKQQIENEWGDWDQPGWKAETTVIGKALQTRKNYTNFLLEDPQLSKSTLVYTTLNRIKTRKGGNISDFSDLTEEELADLEPLKNIVNKRDASKNPTLRNFYMNEWSINNRGKPIGLMIDGLSEALGNQSSRPPEEIKKDQELAKAAEQDPQLANTIQNWFNNGSASSLLAVALRRAQLEGNIGVTNNSNYLLPGINT